MNKMLVAGLIAGAAIVGYVLLNGSTETSQTAQVQGSAIVEVALPETFSQNAQVGELAFVAKCSSCHGVNAVGQEGVAPPLVHKIYEPGHHGDEAFQRAAALGVRGHHWTFGNMPPVEGITRGDVTMIVAYIRELQSENGID